MKVIFLDIDWVLHPFFWDKDFVQKNVNQILYIVNKTGAKIVISSDWKYWLLYLYDEWNKTTLPPYVWHTDRGLVHNYEFTDLERIREDEILRFLKTCEKWNDNIESWVAIDDMPLKLENFVLIDPSVWITRSDADKVIKLLNQ